MASRLRTAVVLLQRTPLAQSRCLPREFHWRSQTMAHSSKCQPIEEQTRSLYPQKHYYPVRIGDVFKDQYRILAKLGYGAYSTVWLARDEKSNQYASLKVCIEDKLGTSPTTNEVKMLQRLSKISCEADHPGLDFTRLATDIFEIEGPTGGRHHCIVTKPQGSSIRTLQETFPNAKLPKLLVKSLVHRLLFSLNWLHFNCGVIHTDVSPQNILAEAEDETVFRHIEEREAGEPSSPVTSDGVPVYRSQNSLVDISGIPILTDFGQMRLAEPVNNDWYMSDLYRAPEVLLGLPWSYPVDVWCVGVMTLELLEGKNLFDPIDRNNDQYVLPLALSQYIAYLGPPPLDMIKRSPLFQTYFDGQGNWISEPPIPKASFEDFITTIPPGEEKEQLLRFIRKILTWDPEPRLTANEAVFDEWLMRPI